MRNTCRHDKVSFFAYQCILIYFKCWALQYQFLLSQLIFGTFYVALKMILSFAFLVSVCYKIQLVPLHRVPIIVNIVLPFKGGLAGSFKVQRGRLCLLDSAMPKDPTNE